MMTGWLRSGVRAGGCAVLLGTASLSLLAQPVAAPPGPAAPSPQGAPAGAPDPFYTPTSSSSYPIDLPTALRLADANNPTVNVARARVGQALARYDRARVLWIPDLVFGPTFFYHAGIDQNRRGDTFSVSRGNYTLGVGPTLRVNLSDALYLPLVTRQLVRVTASQSQATINNTQLAVALGYLDLLEVYGLLAVNADTLARTEQVLAAAESGAKAGLNKTAADVNRAATEVNVRRQEAIVLRGRAGALAARLAQLLLLDPAVELTPFEVAVVPVVLVPAENSLQNLIAVGQRNRPEVAAVEADLQAASALVRQAKAAPFIPRLQADFIGGGLSGGLNDTFSPLRGQLNTTAALAWQLDNFGAGYAAQVRQQQATYTVANFRVQEVRAQVSAEVAEAARTAAARFDTLAAAQEGVRQALEMYRKFRDVSFGMVGPKAQFDALEPLTAVQALNQARVLYLQQVVEFNRAQFRLYTAIGQPAVCGLDTASAKPLEVPAVPATTPKPEAPPLPNPRPIPRP